uniref:Prolyl endopeptidase n=2 Tax=Strongyloides stercoralis TaxID=6248 RepID=A0AAF5DRX9_STRER
MLHYLFLLCFLKIFVLLPSLYCHEIVNEEVETDADTKLKKALKFSYEEKHYFFSVGEYSDFMKNNNKTWLEEPKHKGIKHYHVYHYHFYWLSNCEIPAGCKPPYCKPPPCKPIPPPTCEPVPPPTCETVPPITCEPIESTTTLKPSKPPKPSTPQKPKTTPKGTTTTTTELIRTSTTTKYENCESMKEFYFGRYESTIKINVTKYPKLEKCETCYNTIFGKTIYNRYQYLENLEDVRTQKFIHQVNSMTKSYLQKSTIRKYIDNKITTFATFDQYEAFRKYGEYYYYIYRYGLKNQSVIMRTTEYDTKGTVFFDLNKYDTTKKTKLEGYTFSLNNKHMAYLFSVDNNKLMTIKFKNSDGEDMDDILENVVLSNIDFAFNERGFFYSAFTDEDGNIISTLHNNKTVYHSLLYHKMGGEQKDDVIITVCKDEDVLVKGSVSEDGKYLFVYFYNGLDMNFNKVLYYPLYNINENKITKEIILKKLFSKYDATYKIITSDKKYVYVLTTKDASTGRVIRVKFSETNKESKNWKTLVNSDPKMKLQKVVAAGEKYLLLQYLDHFTDVIYIHDIITGKRITELDLMRGDIQFISSSIHHSRFFIKMSNQVVPQRIYSGNLVELTKTNKKVKLNAFVDTKIKNIYENKFVIKTVYFESTSNVQVPILIFHRADLKYNSKNPLLLEAYGSYGIPSLPSYDAPILMFVNHFNGIYAVAGVRGGGEYGSEWHDHGKLHMKQNSFDDFIAATEYLINNNYTRPSKLAIHGVADGGLLAAVVSRRRPELYGSVISQIGLFDMLTKNELTMTETWKQEYGDLDNKEDFNYLLSYSPIHNLEMPHRPVQFPCTLLIGETQPNKVFATNTLKYTAEVYNTIQKGIKHQRNPVFAKIVEQVGYRRGKDVDEKIEEAVDIFSFIKETLNIKWKY